MSIINSAQPTTLKRLIKKYNCLAFHAKNEYLKEHYKELADNYTTALQNKP